MTLTLADIGTLAGIFTGIFALGLWILNRQIDHRARKIVKEELAEHERDEERAFAALDSRLAEINSTLQQMLLKGYRPGE